MAVALIDDAKDRGQVQTGPFVESLCCGEWVKDPALRRGVMPVPVSLMANITYSPARTAARPSAYDSSSVTRRRFQRQLAPLRHGVPGVHCQVHDDLLIASALQSRTTRCKDSRRLRTPIACGSSRCRKRRRRGCDSARRRGSSSWLRGTGRSPPRFAGPRSQDDVETGRGFKQQPKVRDCRVGLGGDPMRSSQKGSNSDSLG